MRRRERTGQEVYRPAVATVTIRGRKRLLGRETWYKPGEDEARQENSPNKFSRGETGRVPRPRPDKNEHGMDQNPVKGVLFVPHTPGSVLSKELRENEEKLF